MKKMWNALFFFLLLIRFLIILIIISSMKKNSNNVFSIGSFGASVMLLSAILTSSVYAYNTVDTQIDYGETNADVTISSLSLKIMQVFIQKVSLQDITVHFLVLQFRDSRLRREL